MADLVAKGFDAGVRLGQLIDADMVTVRLSLPFALLTVASPDYLKRHKPPKRLTELREHACLRARRTDGGIAPWVFKDDNGSAEVVVTGPLIANDLTTLLGGALEGMGIAQLPAPMANADLKAGRLLQVLEGFAPTAPGMFLYYPNRHQMLPKLRAFIDHLKSRTVTPARHAPAARLKVRARR